MKIKKIDAQALMDSLWWARSETEPIGSESQELREARRDQEKLYTLVEKELGVKSEIYHTLDETCGALIAAYEKWGYYKGLTDGLTLGQGIGKHE